LGNVASQSDFSGRVTSFTYDNFGRKLSETDPLTNTKTWTYDVLGRVSKVVEDVGGLDKTTLYECDAQGNRTKITDANGEDTAFEYDALSRLTKHILPGGT